MSGTKRPSSPETPQRSNAEQEAHGAAERLRVQMEAALAAIPMRAPETADELEAYADRIERTARDLSVALRELFIDFAPENFIGALRLAHNRFVFGSAACVLARVNKERAVRGDDPFIAARALFVEFRRVQIPIDV